MILVLFLGAGGYFLYQYLQQPRESAVSESIEPEKTDITKPIDRVDRQKEEKSVSTQSVEETQVVSTEAKTPPRPELPTSKPTPQPTPAAVITSIAPAPTPVAPAPPPAAPATENMTRAIPEAMAAPVEPSVAGPSDEARLEAELMLRQMAEEEFNQQLKKLGTTSTPQRTNTSPTTESEADSANTQPILVE
jgi:hypothetical protein